MKEGWNVILKYDPAWASMNLWLVHKRADGAKTVVCPIDLTLTTILEPHEIAPEPTIRFHGSQAHEFLQGLSEGLVEAGYRPDELKASDKEVAAIKAHLVDMQRLVFQGQKIR